MLRSDRIGICRCVSRTRYLRYSACIKNIWKRPSPTKHTSCCTLTTTPGRYRDSKQYRKRPKARIAFGLFFTCSLRGREGAPYGAGGCALRRGRVHLTVRENVPCGTGGCASRHGKNSFYLLKSRERERAPSRECQRTPSREHSEHSPVSSANTIPFAQRTFYHFFGSSSPTAARRILRASAAVTFWFLSTSQAMNCRVPSA